MGADSTTLNRRPFQCVKQRRLTRQKLDPVCTPILNCRRKRPHQVSSGVEFQNLMGSVRLPYKEMPGKTLHDGLRIGIVTSPECPQKYAVVVDLTDVGKRKVGDVQDSGIVDSHACCEA